MSVPARRLPTPPPKDRPSRSPARRPAKADPRDVGAAAPRPLRHGIPEAPRGTTPKRAKHKQHHLGFAIFASTIVGLMVFAIVVLHVLLAQQSFRIDAAEARVEELTQERLELVTEQATLSAPRRIAVWASRHGMRLPDDIRILRAPNGSTDPAGAGTSSDGGD